MNVRFGSACLAMVISCWCCTTSGVLAASNGSQLRRQSRKATLKEYLTPPAAPNALFIRASGPLPNPRNHPHSGPAHPQPRPGPSSLFRRGKMHTPTALPRSQSQGYFSRLIGWLNPFGGGSPPQRLSPPSRYRSDNNKHNVNLDSAYLQPPPGPNSHDSLAPSYGSTTVTHGPPAASFVPPASAYGTPTNSYEPYASEQALPRPPSPNRYQPQQAKNCNPCNQVPWTPLYNKENAVDSRYVSGSVDTNPSKSPISSTNQHDKSVSINTYQMPSLSHEEKMPDFEYGISTALIMTDPNNEQLSTSTAQLNNPQNNPDFDASRSKYRSTFTSPVLNPHFYLGAMPPLFEAKPFDLHPQATDTAYDTTRISELNNQPPSALEVANPSGGNLGNRLSGPSLALIHGQDQNDPFLDQNSNSFMPQNQKSGEQVFQNGETSFGSSYHQQRNEALQSEGSSDQGYVDELPPGAETASGFDDHISPSTPEEFNAYDHGSSNSAFIQTLYGSGQQEATSVKTALSSDDVISEQNREKYFRSGTNHENGNQVTSNGTQQSAEGKYEIHYEQSPIFDLSSGGILDQIQVSNDSSASSSSVTVTIEKPAFVLQNTEGAYGVNITQTPGDSSSNSNPDDDDIDVNNNVTVTATSNELSSQTGQYVRFDGEEDLPSTVDVSTVSSIANDQYHELRFMGHSGGVSQNNSGTPPFQNFSTESQTDKKNYDSSPNSNTKESVHDVGGSSERLETARQLVEQSTFYPRSIGSGEEARFSSGLSDVFSKPTTTEPFLQALMRSYDNINNNEQNNEDRDGQRPDNGRAWFDLRQIHSGSGFQPLILTPVGSSGVESKATDRDQGVKRNKQVQIIIPYTSQYTPEPFHPSPEGRSTKITGSEFQARKVPVYKRPRDYLAQQTRRVEAHVSEILPSLGSSSKPEEVTNSPAAVKANSSIDVTRLQKNIDNWTIQEYSKRTTMNTAAPKSSRPYLSPAKRIPEGYQTTEELVVPITDPIQHAGRDVHNILAGFSFNDIEQEASASDQAGVSDAKVTPPHLNKMTSVLSERVKSTTARSVVSSTSEQDSWKKLPVSSCPKTEERVYVVTPHTVPRLPANHRTTDDGSVGKYTTKDSLKRVDSIEFQSIEKAYQVLPQAVNNLAVASTGPAAIPLWGIMEHKYVPSTVDDSTSITQPILHAGHSKVSHTGQ